MGLSGRDPTGGRDVDAGFEARIDRSHSGGVSHPLATNASDEARSALRELFRLVAVPKSAEVADQLLRAHGSVGALFASLPETVSSASGKAPMAIRVLEAARSLMLASLKVEIASAPLENAQAVVDYLRASMAFARREVLRALYLDGQHRLILDELVHCGTRASVQLPALHIVRRAAALDASGILLAHNHPSGNPRPSSQDRVATRSLAVKLSAIGVTLHDHMIFARSGWVSLRALGLIPDRCVEDR